MALQAALESNDLDKAADIVFTQAKLVLSGIRDEAKVKAITQKLANMFAHLVEETQQ